MRTQFFSLSIPYPIFHVYLRWNQSRVYATTAAYFATRLAGAPRVARGSASALSRQQIMQLQQLLASRGHQVGGIDGILGENTRRAVKTVQQQLGLPADSWPTADLLQRLAAGR